MVKETKRIDIKSALALCNITDEYEEFDKSLKSVMSKGNVVTDIYRLYRISIDEKIRDVKENKDLIKFYLQNEETINKIKNYCPINDFVFNNYNIDGNLSEKSCITDLYEYLNKHKNEKEQIVKTLNKLRELGFATIEFDESLDFTKDKYSINSIFGRNSEVVYVDNIEVLPNYDFGVVEYKTKKSNYKMVLKTLCFDFSKSERTIALNDLLFDLDILPKKMDKKTLFDSIIDLKEERRHEYNKITGSVNLSVKIDDFCDQFIALNEVVDRLDTMTNTKEIKEVLQSIKSQIEELKGKSREFDNTLTNEKNITIEGLRNQKSKVLELRKLKKENCC